MHAEQFERIADRLSQFPSGAEEVCAHVFDIDNVVFNQHLTTNLVIQVAEELPERYPVYDSLRHIRDRTVRGLMPVGVLHNLTLQYIERGFFVGLPCSKVAEIAKKLACGLITSINAFPLEVVTALRVYAHDNNGGSLVIAITGAPEEIALPFCVRLGFDGVISTVYAQGGDGYYLRVKDLDAAYRKGLVMDRLAELFGFKWGRSIGMGDSMRDLPILQRVGYPVAVNPDLELLAYIRNDSHIVYAEESGERGVRLYRADAAKRFCEIDHREALPPEIVDYMTPLAGGRPIDGTALS